MFSPPGASPDEDSPALLTDLGPTSPSPEWRPTLWLPPQTGTNRSSFAVSSVPTPSETFDGQPRIFITETSLPPIGAGMGRQPRPPGTFPRLATPRAQHSAASLPPIQLFIETSDNAMLSALTERQNTQVGMLLTYLAQASRAKRGRPDSRQAFQSESSTPGSRSWSRGTARSVAGQPSTEPHHSHPPLTHVNERLVSELLQSAALITGDSRSAMPVLPRRASRLFNPAELAGFTPQKASSVVSGVSPKVPRPPVASMPQRKRLDHRFSLESILARIDVDSEDYRRHTTAAPQDKDFVQRNLLDASLSPHDRVLFNHSPRSAKEIQKRRATLVNEFRQSIHAKHEDRLTRIQKKQLLVEEAKIHASRGKMWVLILQVALAGRFFRQQCINLKFRLFRKQCIFALAVFKQKLRKWREELQHKIQARAVRRLASCLKFMIQLRIRVKRMHVLRIRHYLLWMRRMSPLARVIRLFFMRVRLIQRQVRALIQRRHAHFLLVTYKWMRLERDITEDRIRQWQEANGIVRKFLHRGAGTARANALAAQAGLIAGDLKPPRPPPLQLPQRGANPTHKSVSTDATLLGVPPTGSPVTPTSPADQAEKNKRNVKFDPHPQALNAFLERVPPAGGAAPSALRKAPRSNFTAPPVRSLSAGRRNQQQGSLEPPLELYVAVAPERRTAIIRNWIRERANDSSTQRSEWLALQAQARAKELARQRSIGRMRDGKPKPKLFLSLRAPCPPYLPSHVELRALIGTAMMEG
eukprot:TRINITY_DN25573_c0_g1_i1.p1 TRINITY_DN25573_c0_g1~~TRINITY_DN25573_c0_g1_i1.p1  ORF type:complete len:755 (-),score=75.29 TRINITY_DN25573_c0_g1_i1:23-2287(-)